MASTDRVARWVALDFDANLDDDRHPAFAAQAVFLVSPVTDAIWFPTTSYGFFAAIPQFETQARRDRAITARPRAYQTAALGH